MDTGMPFDYEIPDSLESKLINKIERYYKKNYSGTDVSNGVKCLEDLLVQADIIKDDSLVKRFSGMMEANHRGLTAAT